MTNEELDALEALASRATKGPWLISEDGDFLEDGEAPITDLRYFHMPDNLTNAAFIASSREAVPALIAEVRRLWEAQEWRTMDSAPKDKPILAYWWDRGVMSGVQSETYYNKKHKRWQTDLTYAQTDFYPTHWQPIQPPPVQS